MTSLLLLVFLLSPLYLVAKYNQKPKLIGISPTPSISAINYECPANGWVDCMPGRDKNMEGCTEEAQSWYESNCPNYEGLAF